jgi:hypothetical protein
MMKSTHLDIHERNERNEITSINFMMSGARMHELLQTTDCESGMSILFDKEGIHERKTLPGCPSTCSADVR